jgi:hypothetical protein
LIPSPFGKRCARVSCVLVVIAISVAGCASSHRPANAERAESLRGTYDFQICRSPCEPGDTAAANQLGVLVLDTMELAFPDLGEAEMREFYPAQFAPRNPVTRGCFVVRRGPAAPSRWADDVFVKRTDWMKPGLFQRGDSSSIEIALFETPHSGQHAHVRVRGTRLDGTVRFWEGGPDPYERIEHFVARRLGAPDANICADALRERIRAAPERERVLRREDLMRHAPERVFAATLRALAELGVPLGESDAVTGRISTRPFTTATTEGSVGPLILSFPDSAVIEATVEPRGPGLTRLTLRVRLLLEGNQRPTLATQSERGTLVVILVSGIEKYLLLGREQ